MRKVIVLFVLSLFIFQPSFAGGKNKYCNSYSFSHAIELMKEGKNNEAIPYLKSEIDEHKKNGYAYSLLGHIYALNGEYGEALTNINLSLKYLSKKDEFYSFSLKNRAFIYSKLGDEKNALADYTLRVKLFKKTEEVYCERAQFYIDMNNYEAALKDFESAIRLNPGNAVNFAGKAICFRNMNMIEQAIICCDYAVKLNPEYSLGYSQRGYCHKLMKNYQAAADDYVRALDIDGNDAAYYSIQQLSDSAFNVVDMKLKMMQVSQPVNHYWPYCRAIIRDRASKYKEAIELYEKSNKILFRSITSQNIARCKEELGDYPGALKAINDALASDSSDTEMLLYKARFLHNLGRKAESYRTFERIIELDPMDARMYYWKGWYEKCNHDDDAALEDLNMAIMIFPDYILARNCRGSIYMDKGMKKEANEDFKNVLENDTFSTGYIRAHYVYLSLGDMDKAFACMQFNLKNDSISNFYDAACLYSLAKDEKMALHYLRRALETGYVNFHHIEEDNDLDFIRLTLDFREMIDEYKSKVTRYYENDSISVESENDVVEIPFTHEGGVTKIKCNINGLPLFFVFDTGAADVAISSVEATFMLKNGYLSDRDFVGQQRYMSADGNITNGTVILLRKVKIGDLELDDVRASVSTGMNAPLLLGQSVLQRLGSIEIDNKRDVIKVIKK